MVALTLTDNTIALPQKSNEWYTQARYIEAAREVMGGIDLDPASCELANQVVKAGRYFCEEENGLSKEWYGRVWLNPPYLRTALMKAKHRSTIGEFVQKLMCEYQSGHVTQGVLLATCRPETQWFQPLWQFPICFPDHCVHFLRPFETSLTKYAQMHGTCFVYLGKHEQSFIDVFSEFGAVIPGNVAVRKQRVAPLSLWETQQ